MASFPVSAQKKGSERLEPLGNKVIIRRDPTRKKSDGGVIFADISHVETYLGTVEAIGPGLSLECPKCHHGHRGPMRVKVGDKVIIPDLGGQEIKDWDDGEPVVIIEEDFLHGRVVS
jgi:co-chaperonin GroES (HSP10)